MSRRKMRRKMRKKRKVGRVALQLPAPPPSCEKAATAWTPSTGMLAQNHPAGQGRAVTPAPDA